MSLLLLFALPQSANAIGWDSDDFLIGGGSSFTTRIGVFDHDLTFKGYLDTNFVTVAGLDFNAQGQLVAVAGAMRSVRVYEPINGAIVGGFTRQDDLLGMAADLKVAPDGSYVIGTQDSGGGDGARRFLADGAFAQQYGSGDIRAVAVLPGNFAWTSGIGIGAINVFDLTTGTQTGTIALGGFTSVRSMAYSAPTNTVLVVSQGFVREFDLQGSVVRDFASPGIDLSRATRGANGQVFATTGSNRQVLRWSESGDFLGSTFTPVDFGPSGIAWAGITKNHFSCFDLEEISTIPKLRCARRAHFAQRDQYMGRRCFSRHARFMGPRASQFIDK
ncbi:MAG: hypothetical protein H7Z14_05065 [Anaerolineae bacterium]|nr:hypothetical protein [Phycisphaerae bacterium]